MATSYGEAFGSIELELLCQRDGEEDVAPDVRWTRLGEELQPSLLPTGPCYDF